MDNYKFHPLFYLFLDSLANGKVAACLADLHPHDVLPMMPGCEWQRGDQIIKVAEDAPGDRTPLGTKGIVVGGMHDPDMRELYFVDFSPNNDFSIISACIKWKLSLIKKGKK